jgi:hypothetical protein
MVESFNGSLAEEGEEKYDTAERNIDAMHLVRADTLSPDYKMKLQEVR